MKKNGSPFVLSPAYWRAAALEFRNLRSLVLAGLTIVLSVVLSSLYIPAGLNLRVTVAFLPIALGSMLFGPAVGLAAGVAYDLVGFIAMPAGPFFPGYTLSSMLEFLIYGLFLYRRQVTVLRVLFCKLIINFGVHVGLGCLWSSMLYGKGYYYFFAKSIVKNTLLLPIEVVLLVVVLRLLLPVLTRRGLVPEPKGRYIRLR